MCPRARRGGRMPRSRGSREPFREEVLQRLGPPELWTSRARALPRKTRFPASRDFEKTFQPRESTSAEQKMPSGSPHVVRPNFGTPNRGPRAAPAGQRHVEEAPGLQGGASPPRRGASSVFVFSVSSRPFLGKRCLWLSVPSAFTSKSGASKTLTSQKQDPPQSGGSTIRMFRVPGFPYAGSPTLRNL